MKLKYRNQYIVKYSMIYHEFTLGTIEEAREFGDIEIQNFIDWFGITDYEVI